MVVAILNVALLGASVFVMLRTLMPASGVSPSSVPRTELVNDSGQSVFIQPGACSAASGCSFGVARGIELQTGRSYPILQLPAIPGASFVYRVSDASGKVLGCATGGASGPSQINVSALPACP